MILERIYIWLVVAFTMVMALVLGVITSWGGTSMVAIMGAIMLVAFWAFLAKDWWWIALMPICSFGGLFYFGFKLKPHEIGVVVCVFPLLLALATRWADPLKGRERPPVVALLLTLYMVAHWIASILYNKYMGLQGFGNVSRYYFSALWPLIFFYFFYFYGNTKHIKYALNFSYLFIIARVALNIYTGYNDKFIFIPGINFILPGSTGGLDLRGAGVDLGLFSICYFSVQRFVLLRFFHVLVFFGSFYAVLLGGSRISLVIYFCIPLVWLILKKAYITLILLICCFFTIVTVVNTNYQFLYQIQDPLIKRSVSGLIFNKDKSQDVFSTSSSDEWHQRLRVAGFQRWLETPLSIAIGHGIRPYDEDAFVGNGSGDVVMEAQVEVAAKVGGYEAGLLTVLSTVGLLGLFLYGMVMFYLLKDIVPALWREGLVGYHSIIYAIASFYILVWIGFCWTWGGYPSYEMFLALLAKGVYDDHNYAAGVATRYAKKNTL